MADDLTDNRTVPEARARADRVLDAYPDQGSFFDTVGDLIADLLHLAESYDEDINGLLERARLHYDAEREDR